MKFIETEVNDGFQELGAREGGEGVMNGTELWFYKMKRAMGVDGGNGYTIM